MRTITAKCGSSSQLFLLQDPDAPVEGAFEFLACEALAAAFPHFQVIVFGGSFLYDGRRFKPDLALIARDYSQWFVVEVELVSHSFDLHVLPQVKAFVYGEAQSDCLGILERELAISTQQAETLLQLVPRGTLVIANRRDLRWEQALSAHSVSLLTISCFEASDGTRATEIEGYPHLTDASLGFGIYFATDRSVRFEASVTLPLGPLQVLDVEGVPAMWTARKSGTATWLSKDAGTANIEDRAYVQVLRTKDSRLRLRTFR